APQFKQSGSGVGQPTATQVPSAVQGSGGGPPPPINWCRKAPNSAEGRVSAPMMGQLTSPDEGTPSSVCTPLISRKEGPPESPLHCPRSSLWSMQSRLALSALDRPKLGKSPQSAILRPEMVNSWLAVPEGLPLVSWWSP